MLHSGHPSPLQDLRNIPGAGRPHASGLFKVGAPRIAVVPHGLMTSNLPYIFSAGYDVLALYAQRTSAPSKRSRFTTTADRGARRLFDTPRSIFALMRVVVVSLACRVEPSASSPWPTEDIEGTARAWNSDLREPRVIHAHAVRPQLIIDTRSTRTTLGSFIS